MSQSNDKDVVHPSASDFHSGQDIGVYRVIRCLGRGGMGIVYEVEHRALGTRFALKMFTLEKGDVDFLRKRFLTEGRLLARLKHPRLVRVYDLAVDETTGSPYFTMDLVLNSDGNPATLEQVRRKGGVQEDDVARWYSDLQEGLNAIHRAGVVHRDVKLENVLLDESGHAVLSDFGVSRILVGGIGAELNVTTTLSLKTPEGTRVLGTNGYLAPELRAGEAATVASDYYALGFLLFRLLTGVWYEPNTGVFDLLAPFDPQWREVLGVLLDPDPAKRQMLPIVLKGGRKGRRRWMPWLAAVAVLAFGAAGAFVAMQEPANRGGDASAATEGKGSSSMKVAVSQKVPAVIAKPEEVGASGSSVPMAAKGEGGTLEFELADGVVLEFVGCPAGSFQMGLKGDRAPDSMRREHKVIITRPFWFGKYPMTVAQWNAATGESVEMTPGMEAIGAEKLPVNETKGRLLDCCSNLTARFADRLPTGYVFRPPTEAEWEYVCRGCGTDPDDVYNRFFRDDDCSWLYAENSSYAPDATNLYIYTDESLAAILRSRGVTEIPSFTSWSGTRVFAPIGEHAPNSWGVYDLNVGGTGAISLDSINSELRAVADANNPGYGSGQTALV